MNPRINCLGLAVLTKALFATLIIIEKYTHAASGVVRSKLAGYNTPTPPPNNRKTLNII